MVRELRDPVAGGEARLVQFQQIFQYALDSLVTIIFSQVYRTVLSEIQYYFYTRTPAIQSHLSEYDNFVKSYKRILMVV